MSVYNVIGMYVDANIKTFSFFVYIAEKDA